MTQTDRQTVFQLYIVDKYGRLWLWVYCPLLLFDVYVGLCPINKWYIIVVTWTLMVCMIYTRSALAGPRALGGYTRQTTQTHVTTI